jgi:predicted kinase
MTTSANSGLGFTRMVPSLRDSQGETPSAPGWFPQVRIRTVSMSWACTGTRGCADVPFGAQVSGDRLREMGLDGIVVVAGVPGSGKTTLARVLAPRLGLPLIAKDTIKEALFDALGTGDLPWSERLGSASHRVMYAVAREAGSAMLEANFWPGTAEHDLIALKRPLLQIYCRCPLDLAVTRYQARIASPDRHPGHLPEHQRDEVIARWATTQPRPLDLDAPIIEVDTAVPVDLDALITQVEAHPPR